MHLVLFRVVLVDDAERVEPHLELDGLPAGAECLHALDELGCEVKSRGRCGSRALAAGVYGLIELLIAGVVVDVRRQRCVADRVERLVERGLRRGQARDALAARAVFRPVDNLG